MDPFWGPLWDFWEVLAFRTSSIEDAKDHWDVNYFNHSYGLEERKLILHHLSQNKRLESLKLSRDFINFPDGWEAVGELLRISTTLKALCLDTFRAEEPGLKYITDRILENTVLETISFMGSVDNVDEDSVKEEERTNDMVANMAVRLLRDSLTLKTLMVDGFYAGHPINHLRWIPTRGGSPYSFSQEAMESIAEALVDNTTLLELRVRNPHLGSYICEALTPGNQWSQGRFNRTLKYLYLEKLLFRGFVDLRFGGDECTEMLQRNDSLEELYLRSCFERPEDWKVFFGSLRSNKSVRKLALQMCSGIGADVTSDCLVGLLQVNFMINIKLDMDTLDAISGRYGLGRRRDLELELERLLKRNKSIAEYMKSFGNLEQPKLGRLYLCGAPRAGKTTLRRNMVNSQRDSPASRLKAKLSSNITAAFGLEKRTQGIEIRTLQGHSGESVAIWDMAGQKEYHVLHGNRYLLPEINHGCLFLFAFGPIDTTTKKFDSQRALERLGNELKYWLTFINSNLAKPRVRNPQVSVVLTHYDELVDYFSSADRYVDWAKEKVQKMRDTFNGQVEIHPTIHAVGLGMPRQVDALVNHIQTNFSNLLADLPLVPDICKKLNFVLANWNRKHKSQPILTSRKFFELCKKPLKLSEILEVVENRHLAEAARNVLSGARKTIPPEASRTDQPRAGETVPSGAGEIIQPEISETILTEAAKTTPPEAAKTTPPEAAKTTPPEAAKTTPPEAAKTTPPEAAKTTPPEAAKTTPPEAAKATQPEAAKSTPPEIVETTLPEAANTAPVEDADKVFKWWRQIVSYLNDVGLIVQFETLDYVVVDVNWLAREFLGMLFHSDNLRKELEPDNHGNIIVYRLETLLEKFIDDSHYKGVEGSTLIKLMKELKICEDTSLSPSGPSLSSSQLFMPSMLQDDQGRAHEGTRRLKWTPARDDSGETPVYAGFRLKCQDSKRTFLSPGLFLRYQVHLFQEMSKSWPRSSFDYELEWNLIRANHNGIEMLIESSGEHQDADYVDILIRISDFTEERRQEAYEMGVSTFQRFCKSGDGCPGVSLQEGILRPACVEKLILCKNREKQAVPREDLEKMMIQKLQQGIAKTQENWPRKIYLHCFEAVKNSEESMEKALVDAADLLSWTDFNEILSTLEQPRINEIQGIDGAIKDLERLGLIDYSISSHPGGCSSSTVSGGIPDPGRGKSPLVLESCGDGQQDDLHIGSRDLSRKMDSIIETLHLVKSNQHQNHEETLRVLRDWGNSYMKTFQEELLMEKIYRVSQLAHDLPRLPYFTAYDSSLPERFVASINLASAYKLHFMCEEPDRTHFVKNQKGLFIAKEYPGEVLKKLRPLVSASAKMVFILVKAGIHLGAGVGNIIPDVAIGEKGGFALKSSLLLTETLVGEIATPEQIQSDFDFRNAWNCLVEEVIGPVNMQGKIPELFGLYRAVYKAALYKPSTSEKPQLPSVHWICRECRKRAERAGRLVTQSVVDFQGFKSKSQVNF